MSATIPARKTPAASGRKRITSSDSNSNQHDNLRNYLHKKKAESVLKLIPDATELHFEPFRFEDIGESNHTWNDRQLFLGEGEHWKIWAIIDSSRRYDVAVVLEEFSGEGSTGRIIDNVNEYDIMYPFRVLSEARYSQRSLQVLIAYYFLEAGLSPGVFVPNKQTEFFRALWSSLSTIEKTYKEKGVAAIPPIYRPTERQTIQEGTGEHSESDIEMTDIGDHGPREAEDPWPFIFESKADIKLDYEQLAEAERRVQEIKLRIQRKERELERITNAKLARLTEEQIEALFEARLRR